MTSKTYRDASRQGLLLSSPKTTLAEATLTGDWLLLDAMLDRLPEFDHSWPLEEATPFGPAVPNEIVANRDEYYVEGAISYPHGYNALAIAASRDDVALLQALQRPNLNIELEFCHACVAEDGTRTSMMKWEHDISWNKTHTMLHVALHHNHPNAAG